MEINVEGVGNVRMSTDSHVSDLVKELDHHLDAIIVVKDGRPVPLDHPLEDGDTIKVLSVVSGG